MNNPTTPQLFKDYLRLRSLRKVGDLHDLSQTGVWKRLRFYTPYIHLQQARKSKPLFVQWRKEGLTLPEIVDVFAEIYQFQISPATVSRWINS
jgi:hypothetical protein